MKNNNYKSRNTENRNRNNPSLSAIEQQHRHKIERQAQLTFRAGQFFGFIYNISILVIIYNLINNDNDDLAFKIFFAHSILLSLIILTGFLGKKKSRPRNNYNQKPRSNYNRNSNRR